MRIKRAKRITVALEELIITSGTRIVIPISVRRLRMKWPLSMIGTEVILPSSFATAIRLPLNVILPTIRAILPVNFAISEIAALLPMRTTKAIIAEAAPPEPFNKATNWGIFVMVTCNAKKQPIKAPATSETQSIFIEIILLLIIVVAIAINMQAAPRRLPILAVLGEFISRMLKTIPRIQTKSVILQEIADIEFPYNLYFLNIFNMRSVTKKPPTTLIAARAIATAPINRLPVPIAEAVAINAPEIATPDKAFIPDIRGV